MRIQVEERGDNQSKCLDLCKQSSHMARAGLTLTQHSQSASLKGVACKSLEAGS